MLKGTGTRASKSRLTVCDGARESSHTTFQSARDERKTRRILWLLFLKKQKREKEEGEKKESGLFCFFSAGPACLLRGRIEVWICEVMWFAIIGGRERRRRGKEGCERDGLPGLRRARNGVAMAWLRPGPGVSG